MSPSGSNWFQSRRFAERYAQWYESPRGKRLARLEQRALGTLLDRRFPGAATAVEIGCGAGAFTEWLASRGLACAGVDRSAAMLAVRPQPANACYVRADARRLPFAANSFDLSVMVTSLEFLPDPEAAVREAARVSRRGMLLGVLNRWSWTSLRRRVESWFRESVYRDARFYSRRGLHRLLAAALDGRVSDLAVHFSPRAGRPVGSTVFLALAVVWKPLP